MPERGVSSFPSHLVLNSIPLFCIEQIYDFKLKIFSFVLNKTSNLSSASLAQEFRVFKVAFRLSQRIQLLGGDKLWINLLVTLLLQREREGERERERERAQWVWVATSDLGEILTQVGNPIKTNFIWESFRQRGTPLRLNKSSRCSCSQNNFGFVINKLTRAWKEGLKKKTLSNAKKNLITVTSKLGFQ